MGKTRILLICLLPVVFACHRAPAERIATLDLIQRLDQAEIVSQAPGTAHGIAAGRIEAVGKEYRAVVLKSKGTIRYYEKLTPSAVLDFGCFLETAGSKDAAAGFTVTLRSDEGPSHVLFRRDLAAGILDRERISLAPFIGTSPGVVALEFTVERKAGSRNRAAWIQPLLLDRLPEAAEPALLQEMRRRNAGANVVVVVLDAASALHTNPAGYAKQTTPVMSQLAGEGAYFDRAYCQAVYTLSSTASLMTGALPSTHRVVFQKSALPDTFFTLAEAFQQTGYRTASFLSNVNASGAFGLAQGFQDVHELFRVKDATGHGEDLTDAFAGWASQTPRPFFAYIHYREPHYPFDPPREWRSRFVSASDQDRPEPTFEYLQGVNFGKIEAGVEDRKFVAALYDANLAYGDAQVGRLVRTLKELGIYDRTILIVTGDHGEAFWEHGFQGHNSQLYEESVRIPLAIKFAAGTPVGTRRVSHPVRTIDLYPTLVDLLGISRRYVRGDGTSFLPYLDHAPPDDRAVLIHTLEELSFAFLDGGCKYILDVNSGKQEVYDLAADPAEQRNIVAQKPVFAGYARSRVMAALAANQRASRMRKVKAAVMDEQMKENLRSLGYLQGD